MEKRNRKIHPIIWISCVVAVLVSVVALIFSIAAINGDLLYQLEFDYNNTIGVAGIIFAVAGVVITIYFVTFGHKTFEIYKKLSDAEEITDKVNSDMRNNLVEITNLISSIKGIKDNEERHKYLSLAEGRLLCSSRFSTDDEKKTGISYLQQFSNKEKEYDIELLEKVAKEARKEKKTDLYEAAEEAIEALEG